MKWCHMKTKDKTPASRQDSLCRITQVGLTPLCHICSLMYNYTGRVFMPHFLWILRPWMDIPLWQLYIGCCYSMYLIYDYRHEYCTLWLNEKYFSSEMSMDLQKSGTDCKPPTGMCLSLRLVPEAKCWENKPAFSLCFLSREMFLNGHISCLFLIFSPNWYWPWCWL